MEEKKVEVKFPKFKTESSFSLSGELSQMGMSVAFSPQADFSGMTGKKNLMISEVVDAPNWIVAAYMPLSIFNLGS